MAIQCVCIDCDVFSRSHLLNLISHPFLFCRDESASIPCTGSVEQLFLAVLQGCLQFVIVVFPDHTHLLFYRALQIMSHFFRENS